MRSARLLSILAMLAVVPGLHPRLAEGAATPAARPESPAARRLRELLDVVNSGDRAQLARYTRDAFAPSMLQPDDSILDFLLGQYHSSGGFDVRGILQDGESQTTALVQGRSKPDTWLRYVVGVEPAPPHRIRGIFTNHASPAMADSTKDAIREADLPARFAALVDRIAADARFSGSVCLARHGKVLLRRAWGEADRETHARNTPETRFGIASVGKLFTAVAIARLVEDGRIAYGDSASRYVPDWLPPGGEGITVEHLLTHTSGLGDFLGRLREAGPGDAFDRLEDYRRFASGTALASRPGTEFRYSNTGFLVLGAILERVTGERWDAWILKRVLGPAGARHATPTRATAREAAAAHGYHPAGDGGWVRSDTLMVGHGTPAGGGVATAEDLALFASAWSQGRLVSRAMVERMTTPRTTMAGTGLAYGLGVEVAASRGTRRVYGHHGGFAGVGALVEVFEPEGWTLAVLSNTTDGASPVGDAWRDLLARVRGPASEP
jgi:CubicO group peptidase (beta-lactamase class C family)